MNFIIILYHSEVRKLRKKCCNLITKLYPTGTALQFIRSYGYPNHLLNCSIVFAIKYKPFLVDKIKKIERNLADGHIQTVSISFPAVDYTVSFSYSNWYIRWLPADSEVSDGFVLDTNIVEILHFHDLCQLSFINILLCFDGLIMRICSHVYAWIYRKTCQWFQWTFKFMGIMAFARLLKEEFKLATWKS